MFDRWQERHPLLVFVSITLAGILGWLFILLFLWIFLRLLGRDTDPWMMVEALSTAVASAAVLGAGFVATRELSELANSRHIELADKLFRELNSPENVAARRWIFQNLPADPVAGTAELTEEGRDAIKRVLNTLDHVAFLTQRKWIPEEMIMPWMNPMVIKSWEKLGPYVEYERRRRSEPDYYRWASELADRSLAWRQARHPGAGTTWLDDAI